MCTIEEQVGQMWAVLSNGYKISLDLQILQAIPFSLQNWKTQNIYES